MKKNKKSTLLLVLTLIILSPVFESCQKYPDGPSFSLRSRKARVANTWTVENYKVNGTDFTSLVASYTETFSKDGDYSYSWGLLSGSGNWTFQNKDAEIKLNGTDEQASRTLYITKLEEKSFWYYYLDGSDKYEIHLIGN